MCVTLFPTETETERLNMAVSVGAPMPSFRTSCQQVCLPRWKPVRTQNATVASSGALANVAVEP